MQGYAFVPPKLERPGKTGTLKPVHRFKTHADMPDQGDPFNTRNIVYPGDFYRDGKPWVDPGHHVNIYENVAGIHAVAETFFGFVSKLAYIRQASHIVRGRQTPLGPDVNLEAPAVAAYGDFATYTASQRIPLRG